MRTMDRTYLASLGFNDPDKGNDLHEQTCLYLSQPDKLEKLWDFAGMPRSTAWEDLENGKWVSRELPYDTPQARLGYRLGEKQLVGFIDVLVSAFARCYPAAVIVEVKCKPLAVSLIIQQVNLYRQYLGRFEPTAAVAALTYPISELEKSTLREHDIKVIRIDPALVRAFIESQKPSEMESF
jgi:hypothetical protein